MSSVMYRLSNWGNGIALCRDINRCDGKLWHTYKLNLFRGWVEIPEGGSSDEIGLPTIPLPRTISCWIGNNLLFYRDMRNNWNPGMCNIYRRFDPYNGGSGKGIWF